ncbi:hypothetical protein [Rhodococcus daqingensis]|uniref:Mycothiol-dependent maleylpyruvate isomerase metal-binding domain-containing protein n=1 Tax=Rhodococcus daqingensis TaxID=2479363 RepID=A0ABW2RZL0_9NOCA
MSLTRTTREELADRCGVAFSRFLDLSSATPADIRVGDGAWSAADVATHVLTVFRRYNDRDLTSRQGLSSSVAGLHEQNDAELRALAAVSHGQVLEELRTEWGRFALQDMDMDGVYPFHCGGTIDGYGGWGNMLGELLIHGYDIAMAAGRPWPLDDRDAVLILNGVFQVAPGFVDPARTAGVVARVEFRVPGGDPQVLAIDHGRCGVEEARRAGVRPDVVIGGPAPGLLLSLYQRIGVLAAARRGVLIRGGRRPWLALRLTQWFPAF